LVKLLHIKPVLLEFHGVFIRKSMSGKLSEFCP
jgi:hypothetical protein